jgi:hypothetical protein
MFRSQNPGSRWLRIFVVLFVIGPAGAVRAGMVTVTVEDFTQSFSESASPPTPPLFIDRTFSVPHFGDGEAFVSSGLTSGLARMGARLGTPPARAPDGTVINAGSYQIDAILSDTYTFHSTHPRPLGTSTLIVGHFGGTGAMILPTVDAEGDGNAAVASVSVNSPGGGVSGTLFDQVALTSSPGTALTGIPLRDEGSYGVLLTTDFSFFIDPTNNSRDFTFDLRITGSNGAAVDFFDPAQVSFDLPPGVSVTSAGGFFQSGDLSSVPEPSTLALLGIALGTAGLTAARRVRERQMASSRNWCAALRWDF